MTDLTEEVRMKIEGDDLGEVTGVINDDNSTYWVYSNSGILRLDCFGEEKYSVWTVYPKKNED